MQRTGYLEAVGRTGLMVALAAYDPHVAGTPPLGLELPTSDVDVLCHAPDPAEFAAVVWEAFSHEAEFLMGQWIGESRPVIASFRAYDWRFEIFGHPSPVHSQNGWRHFAVERRLLALAAPAFRTAIMQMRVNGMKTEPAFAAILELKGDPYRALLELEQLSDEQLAHLLATNGFAHHRPIVRPIIIGG